MGMVLPLMEYKRLAIEKEDSEFTLGWVDSKCLQINTLRCLQGSWTPRPEHRGRSELKREM